MNGERVGRNVIADMVLDDEVPGLDVEPGNRVRGKPPLTGRGVEDLLAQGPDSAVIPGEKLMEKVTHRTEGVVLRGR